MTKQSSLYLDAIQGKPIGRTPIWIMRQAGRYLPEYMAVREKHDFLTVCHTPELAAEVTLQPIRRFGFDAAILFSDILVIPAALGQNLEFLENHGPRLSPQILTHQDLERLVSENIEERLDYVARAVSLIRSELAGQVPLIGFSGSPFTLATYMIEGKPTRNFKFIKTMLYQDPELLHKILDMLTAAVIRYLNMQIQAGAQAVQIFDTWGGILPVHLYESCSAGYMRKIIQGIQSKTVPVTVFGKGGIDVFRQLKDTGANMLGVDWMTSLAEARSIAGEQVALQGNLDPTALYGSRETIREEVGRILTVFPEKTGHVFNLGHGILPDIPVDNVAFLVDEVRRQSESG